MIIALGYMARTGKDTVADYLVSRHGFAKIAFADALKDGVQAIFGLTNEQLYGGDKEKIDEFWEDTPRNILQKVGTECMRRGYRDDIWVKCVEGVIQANPSFDWVISDCRFLNETNAVKKWGSKVVQVVRSIEDGRLEIATSTHASETTMRDYEGWDDIIVNCGTLGDLYRRVDSLVEDFRETKKMGIEKVEKVDVQGNEATIVHIGPGGE